MDGCSYRIVLVMDGCGVEKMDGCSDIYPDL